MCRHIQAAAEFAASAIAGVIQDSSPLEAATALGIGDAADQLLCYLLQPRSMKAVSDLPAGAWAGNEPPSAAELCAALQAFVGWTDKAQRPGTPANVLDTLATVSASALAVLASAQMIGGSGGATEGDNAAEAGQISQRIMMGCRILIGVICSSLRAARLAAEQGAVSALLNMLDWAAGSSGLSGADSSGCVTEACTALCSALVSLTAADSGTRGALAGGDKQGWTAACAAPQQDPDDAQLAVGIGGMSVTGSHHKDVFFEGHGTLCRVAGCSICCCRPNFLTYACMPLRASVCRHWHLVKCQFAVVGWEQP